MGVSRYQEHAVDSRLADYVSGFWSLSVQSGDGRPHAVLPDGCIDLLYDAVTGTLSVVGTMTRALWKEHCGHARFVGVRFRPGGATPLLHDTASAFTDDIVDATDVFGTSGAGLEDRLRSSTDVREQTATLQDFVFEHRSSMRMPDARVAWACARLREDPSTRVESLAIELGLSRQYLRRLFLQETGVAPKDFARILRMQTVVAQMPSRTHLADLALASGYSDQAHMCRDFEELVGMSPSRFRTTRFGPGSESQ